MPHTAAAFTSKALLLSALLAAGVQMSAGFLAPTALARSAFSPASRCVSRAPTTAVRARVVHRGGVLQLRSQEEAKMADLDKLDLSEETVVQALEEAKEMLGTIFGNSAENRAIGITGDVEMTDVDGPFVTVSLSGRFWHKRVDVLARVANYLTTRIPEVVEVYIQDPEQLDDEKVQPSQYNKD